MITSAQTPVFQAELPSAVYEIGQTIPPLNGTATVTDGGSITYQWQSSANGTSWANITGATGAAYTPPASQAGVVYYRVIATNTNGYPSGLTPSETLYPAGDLYPVDVNTVYTASATSNAARIEVAQAAVPVFNAPLASASYAIGDTVTPLDGTATTTAGTLTYQWQSSPDQQTWTNISGQTGATYTPPASQAGVVYYRVIATSTLGSDQKSATSNAAAIEVYGAQQPMFAAALQGAVYNCGDAAVALDGTAMAPHGTISYQWYADGEPIDGADGAAYTPPTDEVGSREYYVTATNTVGSDTASTRSNTVTVTVYGAEVPTFTCTLTGAEYDVGDAASALDGTATAERGTISYQWYCNGQPIPNGTASQYAPGTEEKGVFVYYVVATNTVGTSQESATSETATVTVYGASPPVFAAEPKSAAYIQNDPALALFAQAYAERGTVTIHWQELSGGIWSNIPGATGNSYTPPTGTAGTFQYRAAAVNTVGTDTEESISRTAVITVTAAQVPSFRFPLDPATYQYAAAARALDGSATVADGGTITYQWYRKGAKDEDFSEIPGAVEPKYIPSTVQIGAAEYYVIATNTLHQSISTVKSNTVTVTVIDNRASESQKWEMYLREIQRPFQKLVRLDFLQPDGSVAFSLDNNHKNRRSGAFIQDGTLEVNLQNGQRRKASVLLSNLDSTYEFSVNKVWFGQQLRLMEGILLSNGDEFYLPQGVFYVSDPQETFQPNRKTVVYNLLDKWAYLDGTLFGNLEGIYEVPVNTNILKTVASILALDRGNGYPLDRVPPIFSDYWNDKTVTLESGETISVLLTPYTYRCESMGGCYADILLEMATMLVAWIGYDQTGHLRVDAGDDDILDIEKPILWTFTPSTREFLGATYSPKITSVYNDIIVEGQALQNGSIPMGRATNMDPRSDTNIFSSLGRRTKREEATGYYAVEQCKQYAAYLLKRNSIIQKSVSISSSQIFHIAENSLIQVRRPDKPGAPTERHLVTGFSRPLAGTGEMTIQCTSVQDFPEATITPLPGEESTDS